MVSVPMERQGTRRTGRLADVRAPRRRSTTVPGDPRLTARQKQILDYVTRGWRNADIARELGVGEQAVKAVVSRIFKEFGQASRAGLVGAAATASITGRIGVQPPWLHYLFRKSPISIAVFRGPNHVCDLANDAAIRIAGGRELVGRPLSEAIPEVVGQHVLERLDLARRTGETQLHYEQSGLLDIDGNGRLEERFFNYRIEPTREDNGAVGALIVFASEVTQEVRARRAIDELQADLAVVLEQMPNGVVAVGLSGRIIFANAAARRIGAALTRDHSPSASVTELLNIRMTGGREHPKLRDRALAQALTGSASPPVDYATRSPRTGRDIRVRVTAGPLRSADGQLRGAIAVFTELDEEK